MDWLWRRIPRAIRRCPEQLRIGTQDVLHVALVIIIRIAERRSELGIEERCVDGEQIHHIDRAVFVLISALALVADAVYVEVIIAGRIPEAKVASIPPVVSIGVRLL